MTWGTTIPDQLLMYDNAVKSWITSQFGSLVSGKTLYLMIGTPDRAFAEYETPTSVDPDGRPPMPRAALTVEDPEVDPERFNPNKIRTLGYYNDDTYTKLNSADYPASIRLPYTLNFWAEYKHQMNLYIQRILKLFKSDYTYLSVDIDAMSPIPVYGTKSIGLFADGGIMNTGDLEPGGAERMLRRTFSFHMKAWLWDFDFITTRTVREVTLEMRDYDSEDLFEMRSTPTSRQLFDGDGSTTEFSDSVELIPIIRRTFFIDATVGGNNVRGFDDGAGAITGTGIASGTVDYDTGAVAITYDTAPDDLTEITVGYYTTW